MRVSVRGAMSRRGATTLVLSALLGGAALAGSQPAIDLDRLILDSGFIGEVRVTSVDPSVGVGGPATRIDYAIERGLFAGAAPAGHFTLPEGIEPGGAIVSSYIETPGFTPGETYLLFLRHTPWRISPVTHWADGFLRAVTVAGRTVYVDAGGACVVELRDRVRFGPRIVDPPAVPGRGGQRSSHAPRPSAVGDCLSAAQVRLRVRVRMRQLDWRPAPLPISPVGPVGVHITAEVP